MKLEKRGDSRPAEVAEENAPREKKPVVLYIMILFIAAFLLMALSFASHQRSNTEALGKLQSDLTAMHSVQEAQQRAIELQNDLTAASEENAALREQLEQEQEYSERIRRSTDAFYYLYALQLQYLNQDYAACQATIQAMEDGGLTKLLPDGGGAIDVTAPYVRYHQLKEAVEAAEAQAAP